MKGIVQWLRGRHGKRTWLLMLIGVVSVCALGGGAYAALGGSVRQSSSGDINLQKGLVGHWKMDGNAKDATPNANNGTVTGAVLTADRKERANSAFDFGGANHHVNIPSSTSLTATPNNQWTMAAWIYPTSLTGNQVIVRKDAAGGGYFLRLGNTHLESLFSDGGGFAFNSLGTVALNQWQHVAAVYDGASVRHYINGFEVGVAATNIALSFNSNPVVIGREPSGAENFNGKIDDVRLYNRAIKAEEIKALHDAYDAQINAGSGQSGLVGHWKMDGNAKDSTPHANNGTSNGAVLTTDRKGRSTGAYNFNGSSANIDILNSPSLVATPNNQ